MEKKQEAESRTPPYTPQHTHQRPPESESNSAKREDSVGEQTENTAEFAQPNKEPETQGTSEPKGGINWEEFVSITKSKTEEGRLDADAENKSGVDGEENSPGFDWTKLSIDQESEEPSPTTPQFFDESSEEKSSAPRENEPSQNNRQPVDSIDVNGLVIDNDKSFYTAKSVGAGPAANNPQYRLYASADQTLQRQQRLAGRLIKKSIYLIIILVAFSVIISAGAAILANQGFIPQDQLNKFSSSVLSKFPFVFGQDVAKDLAVSDVTGRWMTTRNGFIYVVTGKINNQSKYVINYVQLRSDFLSDGKSLFENVVYAGNTFTENELETLSMDVIMNKLGRKNGDINFDDPKKLAGLNYGIEPGESVPFFAIFPSKSQILGLKFRVNVAAFEKSVSRE